jgi:DNA primase
MQAVLDHYKIRLRRVNQTALRGKCPLPTHSSETSKESFGVQTVKNIWACQSSSCASTRQGKKGGNVIDFVATMENCSIHEAALKLHEWFLSATSTAPGIAAASPPAGQGTGTSATGKLVAEKRSDAGAVVETNKPLSFTLQNVDSSHPYLRHRGIKPETAEFFGAGYFAGRGTMSGRVVIPIHNERGQLIAYAGRSIDETEPKYKLPAGFHKAAVLFNLDSVLELKTTRVVVVEGFFDTMKVHQAGFPAVVALMGRSLSAEQYDLLAQHFSQVVLMLDGDDTGRSATKEIADRLMYSHFVRVVSLNQQTQPDQLSSAEISTILGPVMA